MATATTTQALQPLEINGIEINVDALINAIPPVPKELGARELVIEARGFTECDDSKDYEMGADLIKRLRKLERDQIPSHYEPYRQLFYKPYCAVNEAKKKAIDAVTPESRRIETLMLGWERKEAKRKAEEEARIRREQEAKRQAEIAEMNRKAQEEAEALEAAGKTEKAAQVIEEAAQIEQVLEAQPVVEVILPESKPAARMTGVSSRVSYSAECTDLRALVEAAAKNWEAFGAFLQVNQMGINNMARVQKDAFSIPGCKLVKNGRIQATGR